MSKAKSSGGVVTMPKTPALECDVCTRPAEFICVCPKCKAVPCLARYLSCLVHRDDFPVEGVVLAPIEEQKGSPK